MPYDSNLDKQIFLRAIETGGGKINVGVYSYNNGASKLQLTRENLDAEGNARFAKLGRLSKEEVSAILPLIQEAVSKM